MKRSDECGRRAGPASTVAMSLALLALHPAASAAQEKPAANAKGGAGAAARLPANYRVQIAQYIKARNPYVTRDAKITKPYPSGGGLFSTGTSPTVCVAVYRDNPIGIVVRDNWAFSLANGQVKRTELGMDSCSDLYPFSELKALYK